MTPAAAPLISTVLVTNRIFVAGDIARAPHVLYDYQFLATEFWGNAVHGAEIAAHNMVCAETERRPHLIVPSNWSGQFGVNIKTVGVPSFGDEIIFTQGSVKDRRFAAAYGKRGRIVGAVTFDHGKWLPFYEHLIMQSAPFPPSPARLRCACRLKTDAGRFPAQRCPHRDSRCRPHWPQSGRAAGRVPPAAALMHWRQR